MKLTAKKNFSSELRSTFGDFKEASERFSLSLNLAIQDIRTRYRGSVIGPWWITLTSGTLILGIGLSYTYLFHVPVEKLLPYVAIGIVTWSFISSCIAEGGESFVTSAAIMRQSSLPLPTFILRTLLRNLINLGHQLVIVVGVLAWFRIFPGLGILWSVLGLAAVLLNLCWVAMLVALVSARFRDVPQIVSSLLQFIFFMSPIFWIVPPALEHSFVVAENPFFFAVQAVRAPLLDGTAPLHELAYLALTGVIGWIVAILFYNQTRRRVVHYL
jgi:ABC-type polysaccharide/polyol phosphate export permease